MRQSTNLRSQGAPMSHKIIVGTIATFLGAYVTYKVGSDFEYVKYEPRSPEEVQQRLKDGTRMQVKFLDQVSLKLKPEAEERIYKQLKEQQERQKQDDTR